MSKEFNIDELRWVRVFSPVAIPKYLVEQVKGREYGVNEFFKHQEINCLVQGKEGPTLNPFNHLYVLVDEDNIIKGYLWFVIDSLSKDLFINTYSIDKNYWHGGKAVERLSNHVKEIMKKLKLSKVFWLTRYPKHSMRYGFKRAKETLMTYTEGVDGPGIHRRDNSKGKHRSSESTATTTIQPDAGATGAASD